MEDKKGRAVACQLCINSSTRVQDMDAHGMRKRCRHTITEAEKKMLLTFVNGRRWKLQVGSKEQQTRNSQRFLSLFLLFFWMVHTRGRRYSLSPSLVIPSRRLNHNT